MENENKIIIKETTSVLEGDGYSFDRLLLREPSIGGSSHIYYRTCEGVPFQWEMQPGRPKDPPESNVISPLTPPPSHQNNDLPKPCLNKQNKPWFTGKRIMFWKKKKNQCQVMKENQETVHVDMVESLGRFDSDRKFECSSCKDSSLSSSSLASSIGFPHLQKPKRSLVCSPWNITTIMVPFAKRG